MYSAMHCCAEGYWTLQTTSRNAPLFFPGLHFHIPMISYSSMLEMQQGDITTSFH